MQGLDFITIISYVLAVIIGYLVYYIQDKMRITKAKANAQKIIEDANRKAENIIKEASVDAKSQVYELKLVAEKEIKESKGEIAKLEKDLRQREKGIEKRDAQMMGKEESMSRRISQLDKREQGLESLEIKLQEKIDAKIVELEKVAAMTASEAKEALFRQVEQETAKEMTAYIKEQEEEAQNKANLKAREVIANALDRYAQEMVVERTVATVALPSEEMKGRIIGREGRNIKAIEQATGADLIIDDTPEAITISCFDPVRREVARLSLEKTSQRWPDSARKN